MTEIIDIKSRKHQGAQVPLQDPDTIITLLNELLVKYSSHKKLDQVSVVIIVEEPPAEDDRSEVRILTLTEGTDHTIGMMARAQATYVSEVVGLYPSLPGPKTKA